MVSVSKSAYFTVAQVKNNEIVRARCNPYTVKNVCDYSMQVVVGYKQH